MIKDALIKKLEGDIEVAKADLTVFLDKSHRSKKMKFN